MAGDERAVGVERVEREIGSRSKGRMEEAIQIGNSKKQSCLRREETLKSNRPLPWREVIMKSDQMGSSSLLRKTR